MIIDKLKNNDTVGAVVTAGSLGALWGTIGAVLLAFSAVLLIVIFAKR